MIFTVANSAELEAAWQQTGNGDRIELLGNEYNGAVLRSRTFETPVAIASADPGNPAVFRDSLTISGVGGIEIANIRFAPDSSALDKIDVILVRRSSDVTLQGNTIAGYIPGPGEGLPAHEDIDSAIKAKGLIEGQPFARGIRVVDSSDVRITDNTLFGLRKGIILDTVDGARIMGNHLRDLREDGVNMADAVSVTIAGNLMESFRPLHNYDNIAFADHGDFIQWWAGDGELGIRDLVIRDNALLQGHGSWTQGIFGRGGAAPGGGAAAFSRILIENNLINTSHPNGIFIGDAADVLIAGNTLLPAPMDLTLPVITSGIPGIQIRTSARFLADGGYDFSRGGTLPRGISVQENLVAGKRSFQSYQIDAARHPELGITASGNTVLSTVESHPAFWGSAFPHLTDRPVLELGDLESPAGLAGGIDILSWPERLRSMFARLTGADGSRPLKDGPQGIRVDGTDADETIEGTGFADVLRGGRGSDRITTGSGADVVAFHRSDLRAGDLDVITDLDFSAGDWLSLSGGFGRGFFDDRADPDNSLTTFGSGDSAVVHDLADLREVIAQRSVSARWHDNGVVDLSFAFESNASAGWTLRLHGIPRTVAERAAIAGSDSAASAGPQTEAVCGRLIVGAQDRMTYMSGGGGTERFMHQILVPEGDLPVGF